MCTGGIGILIYWLMMRLSIGSNKELVYMHMHITWWPLKGSNFQEWPKSSPVSGITKDFSLTNNPTSSRTLKSLL